MKCVEGYEYIHRGYECRQELMKKPRKNPKNKQNKKFKIVNFFIVFLFNFILLRLKGKNQSGEQFVFRKTA